MSQRFGVHVTAQVLRVAVFSGFEQTLSHETPHSATSLETLGDAIVSEVQRLAAEAQVEIASVGIALPALVTPADGQIAECELMEWLTDTNLQTYVSSRLDAPTLSDSEINCAASAEQLKRVKDEASAPALCLGLTLYGGAVLILDSKVDRQEDGYGMDFPHLPFSAEGPVCPCGDPGCAQTYVLEPGLRRIAAERGVALNTDEPLIELCERAAADDQGAVAVLEEAGSMLGLLVRALRKKLGLEETEPFFVLHADSHRGTFELAHPLAVHAASRLSQRSSRFDAEACITGAAHLEV